MGAWREAPTLKLLNNIMNDVEVKDRRLPPSKYAVLIEYSVATPDDFLLKVMEHVFNIPETVGMQLTEKCKKTENVALGTYSYEIAEQKVIEATKISRINNMPLEFSLKAL